jgi:Ca-activated chloride channel family protein
MNEVKEHACLKSVSGTPIPLRAVDVSGDVVGGSARIRVRQTYENRETTLLEAIYTFPLPSEATLVGFVMESGGRRIEGVVKEREAAFKSYDDAMLEGHGAALLDQERANVFTAQVGNLLPGETTVVEVEYVQRLHAIEGALRVMIPTLVAPRYIPGNAAGNRTAHGQAEPTDRVPDADRISPKIGPADYTIGLDLALHVGDGAQISSPSHAIAVQKSGGIARVSFRDGRAVLDRDLVLNVEAAEGSALGGLVTHRDGDVGTFALTRVVDLFGEQTKKSGLDVVFLIDRSGSMGGQSIEEARKALRLCLRQLREGDRFSILAFDDRVEPFMPEPVPFTQKTLEQADRWIASVDARGGTELLAPLVDAVERAKGGVVVLLTDGQVGNEDEILKAVLEKKTGARIYTFGIGTNVSDALLTQLARRTGGATEGIHPGERIDEKVVAVFARAIARRVRDVKVKFTGDVEVDELAPLSEKGELPDMVDGEPWVLFGRYAKPGLGRAEIRGTLDGAPWLLEVSLDLPEKSDFPSLPKLWAAERVRDFEAMELTGRRADAMKQRIVELATAHGIASRHTSFVVVETRSGDRRVREAAEARAIPVNAPAGWAMFQRPNPMMMTRAGMVNPNSTLAGGYGGGFGGPPGAPPPPMAAAPMARAMSAPDPYEQPKYKRTAPPAPAPAFAPPPAPQAASKGSVFSRAKDAIAGFFQGSDEEEGASSPAPEMDAAIPQTVDIPSAEKTSGDPAFAILSRQLASGLWDDGKGDTVGATRRALVELLKLGIDTAHPLHGELVRKAIEALVPLAAKDSSALFAAYLAAVGKRTRKIVRDAVEKLGLGSKLTDEAALRKEVLG